MRTARVAMSPRRPSGGWRLDCDPKLRYGQETSMTQYYVIDHPARPILVRRDGTGVPERFDPTTATWVPRTELLEFFVGGRDEGIRTIGSDERQLLEQPPSAMRDDRPSSASSRATANAKHFSQRSTAPRPSQSVGLLLSAPGPTSRSRRMTPAFERPSGWLSDYSHSPDSTRSGLQMGLRPGIGGGRGRNSW